MNLLKPDFCPRCKSDNDIRQIMYGLVTYEGFKEAQKAKIEIRGCVIEPGAPDWLCGSCKYEWSDPNASEEDGR